MEEGGVDIVEESLMLEEAGQEWVVLDRIAVSAREPPMPTP